MILTVFFSNIIELLIFTFFYKSLLSSNENKKLSFWIKKWDFIEKNNDPQTNICVIYEYRYQIINFNIILFIRLLNKIRIMLS